MRGGISILRGLGLRSAAESAGTAEADAVRAIARRLEALPAERARYLAAFAYVLGRAAHADLDISADETRAMEEIVRRVGGLPEEQAALVVEIAKGQNRLFGGTENFLVTREFRAIATDEQRRELLDCCFAVAAADDSISAAEDHHARRIADELGFSHAEFVAARRAWSDKRQVLRDLKR